MASPGELVQVLAKVLDVPAATLTTHDRLLVQAKLRTKGGRGWAAAKVQPIDAANLLTAILGSGQVKDSVNTVQRYGETRPQVSQSSKKLFAQAGIDELAALPAAHSFIDGLAALIASATEGSLARWLAEQTRGSRATAFDVAPLIEIAATTPGTLGDIRIAGVREGHTAQVRYTLTTPWDASNDPPGAEIDAWAEKMKTNRGNPNFEQYRRINALPIIHIAQLLSGEAT